MKVAISFLFILLIVEVHSQELKSLQPSEIRRLDFSDNAKAKWAKRDLLMEEIYDGKKEWNTLSEEDKEIMMEYGEVFEDIWDVVGGGCSWYCGGNIGNITASSYLKSQGTNTYEPANIHDLSYQTAWVEGVAGYGIGEYISYELPPENPRITEIRIVNGYVKSPNAYHSNSRVRKLKMYLNDQPYAILNLKDEVSEQVFKVNPIGHGERSDYSQLKLKSPIKLRFEILEVYKGSKYDDVAISEIYFDGLDVHCFAAGTLVTMSDKSQKPIEELVEVDSVLSFDLKTNTFFSSAINEISVAMHHNLATIIFNDGTKITSTTDHPFFDGEGWVSIDPTKTRKDYQYDKVNQLIVGSEVFSANNVLTVTSIEITDQSQLTYTIVKLKDGNTFFVNNLLVGTEELREDSFCEE